ncbi:MAG: peptidyl-tRNA hydrolase Pth2 [Thermoplasmata archaeon]|uniref:Peptidyl-tRNA hydrolase n=1 Tax=Candidatus Sysuiplasma superficiale TaxID=2823368 RepID=A0A8J7YIP0_9ARCH|nr:peptidyl-tRNA hydrolase Pth2 [Candidatus Sysuiplasma superficiale]MBX8643612.1 peptidyl-tRNA hydrolase Pth2 [Candidatus Sysuiplasma superficiale]MCL4347123.1 peptidyl-tRNA hydrolase Pth2 [Candidatus Thermoplasmatota archaeon]
MQRDDGFRYKLVVVVRTDIKLSPGKLAVQVAHASVGCAVESMEKERRTFGEWMREGQRKVVVRVRNIEELYEVREEAKKRGLVVSTVADAGLTEIPPGTVTCVGIGPARNEDVDPVTGSLSLL